MLYTYKVLSILKVVDADTIDCEITLGFGFKAVFRFRVAHIDAVEKRELLGQEATDFTAVWLKKCLDTNKLLVSSLKSSQATVGIGDGSFGRWLGDFHSDGEHLGDVLVNKGYAVYSKRK